MNKNGANESSKAFTRIFVPFKILSFCLNTTNENDVALCLYA